MSGNAAAIVFLLLFVGAWLAWVLVVLRRPPLTPMQNVLMLVNRLITSLLWRTTAPRDVPLPPGRGGIIVCNHRSSIDPCFVQRGTQRPIHWMVAKEFVANPALRWFMDTCMMILVNRGGVDTAATKIALRYVQKGEVIGMFPEGRINTTRRLMISVRPGAAMIAIKTRAIVLPCYISGSPYGGTVISPLFMPARVTVHTASRSMPFRISIALKLERTKRPSRSNSCGPPSPPSPNSRASPSSSLKSPGGCGTRRRARNLRRPHRRPSPLPRIDHLSRSLLLFRHPLGSVSAPFSRFSLLFFLTGCFSRCEP